MERAKPNLTPDVMPPPPKPVLRQVFKAVLHVVSAWIGLTDMPDRSAV